MSSPVAPLYPPHRRSPFLLTLAVVGSLLLGGGLTAFSPVAAPAQAADLTTDSQLTVAWAGDTSAAKGYQSPTHDETNVHYEAFKNLTVTVSQTRDLVDQAVTVDVIGMPGGTKPSGGSGSLRIGTNYIQAFQCWGDDPLADDFVKTCQWGFKGGREGDYFAETVASMWRDTVYKSLPFLTVWGEEFDSHPIPGKGVPMWQLAGPSTTNEAHSVVVQPNGTARFSFETQTSYAAPHLGCGLSGDSGAGERCWLVIVPRGDTTCSGKPTTINGPSPLVDCNWADRMVVPLDFQPTGGTCPVGAAERPVAGSLLSTGAMSSWQPLLCQDGGTTYGFASVSDSVARGQLLSGQSRFILTGRPLIETTVSEDLTAELERAEIVYAPIAVSGLSLAFSLQTDKSGVVTDLKLSPLLLAKMLTFSYLSLVPFQTDTSQIRVAAYTLWEDPEFQRLNPHLKGIDFGPLHGLTMIGTGSDSQAQLWKYVQSDSRARAFLSGEEVNGDRINIFFLPRGHQDAKMQVLNEVLPPKGYEYAGLLPATDESGQPVMREVGLALEDGTPYCLCDVDIDTMQWADETRAPQWRNDSLGQPFYDLLQYNAPRGTFSEVANDVFRLNPKMRVDWSMGAINASGKPGGYVDRWLGLTPSMIGITDSYDADRLLLGQVALELPNQQGVFVEARGESMAAALGTMGETGVPGVVAVDPTKAGSGAYPLTQIVWGAMRLDGSTPEERADYAAFIDRVTTEGQIPGTSAGQLPFGYVPLTDELKAQAAVAAKQIRDYDPNAPKPSGGTPPTGGTTTTTPTPPSTNTSTTNPGGPGGPNVSAGTGPGETGETETNAPEGLAAVLSAVGGTLLLGASGAIAVPGILRRRESLIE